MPVSKDREYRSGVEFRAAENEEYIVEGYASTYEPYVMYSLNSVDYYEKVDRHAFDGADMSDVIMQYDHSGMVYARQKNGTLAINADDHGLHIRADLSKTAASRELYDAIKSGLVSEMSFAFNVAEDSYNRTTRTRTILRIKKLYDVSAVSIPANPGTEISARNYFDGVIEAEKAERQRAEEREKQKRKIRIIMEVKHGN